MAPWLRDLRAGFSGPVETPEPEDATCAVDTKNSIHGALEGMIPVKSHKQWLQPWFQSGAGSCPSIVVLTTPSFFWPPSSSQPESLFIMGSHSEKAQGVRFPGGQLVRERRLNELWANFSPTSPTQTPSRHPSFPLKPPQMTLNTVSRGEGEGIWGCLLPRVPLVVCLLGVKGNQKKRQSRFGGSNLKKTPPSQKNNSKNITLSNQQKTYGRTQVQHPWPMRRADSVAGVLQQSIQRHGAAHGLHKDHHLRVVFPPDAQRRFFPQMPSGFPWGKKGRLFLVG